MKSTVADGVIAHSNDLRIGDLLSWNRRERPTKPALYDGDLVLSWQGLSDAANRLASGLSILGFGRGSRVATLVKNDAIAVELLFGLAIAGAVCVPLNFGLTDPEIATLLADSDPNVLICDGDLLSRFEKVLATGKFTKIIRAEGAPPKHWLSYEHVKSLGKPDFESPALAQDIRTIRYTSGTTATPKGCLGTHQQILASIANFLKQVPIPKDGPFLQLLPLFSGAGIWMAFAAAYQGVPNVLLPGFDADRALQLIEKHRIVYACGVPTMVRRLCDAAEAGGYDLSTLKLLGYTGAPMPPAVITRAMRVLPCDYYQGFGGGEMGGLISYLLPEDHRADGDRAKRLSSAGRVAAYAEVVVRGLSDGKPVAIGETGEVTVRSPSNFSGYHNREAETAKTLRGEWVYTGDVGFVDEEGFLHIVDRVKDMIVTGGMNVSSAEVEAVLAEHPCVQSTAVVGLKDEEWGEVVTGVVTIVPGKAVTESDLINFARARLAGYKTPKAIRIVSALPLNSAGKILKRELREQLTP